MRLSGGASQNLIILPLGCLLFPYFEVLQNKLLQSSSNDIFHKKWPKRKYGKSVKNLLQKS